MKVKLIYPTIEDVISKHNYIITISGGLHGVKNIGYLESSLDFVQDDLYYPEFEDKITYLVFSINKNHAFEDGNKRTSIAIGALFLELNGFSHIVSRFIREMENIAVMVADNLIDREFLKEIIYCILFEDDYTEEIKLKLIYALESSSKMTDNNDILEDVF